MFSVTTANRADYYRYLARLNFECAQAADRKIGFMPGYEVAAPPPVMTLCAHSIELSLKSFLLQHGVSEAAVEKIGHNLVKCWSRCKKIAAAAGLSLPDIDEHVLEIIGDLLMANRLRYGEKSRLGLVPVYGPLSRLCNQCLDLCGAPMLADLIK